MLQLTDVIFRFTKEPKNLGPGIGPISLEIRQGDFVIITGANGSGKSTLLKVMDGTQSPQSGYVTFGGSNLSGLSVHEKKKAIARVFQDPLQGTVGDFSVLENFRMAWLRGSRFSIVCSSGRKFREQLRQYLSSKGRGFEELLDREIASLSGGQRQVLTVLMNLFNEPSVLLLDEPTAALDAAMSEILLELLQLANQEKGITMVMITHDLHAAIHSGNRLLIMKDGLLEKELTGKEKEELSAESLFGKLYPSNRA